MNEPQVTPIVTPTTQPMTEPMTEPMRRMEPEKICPAQRTRIGETVRRLLP
jgi:hypothetical protein